MAAVTVANDSVRLHDMGDTDGTTGVGSLGGGPGAGSEPDFVFQGSNAVSRKIGTTLAGFDIDTSSIAAADMTAADRPLWMSKLIATNKSALLSIASPALEVRIGSGSGAYYTLQIAGNETEFYPLKGGWLLVPINPNLAAFQGAVTGSPALTAVDYFAIRGDFNATSKSENLAMDAIDVGLGLTLVGGDLGDTDGDFNSFVAFDQGQPTTGRFGFFTELDQIISVFGMHWIGRNAAASTTATGFTANSKTLVLPDGLHGPGNQGFSIDLGDSDTDVNWNVITMIGIGKGNRVRFDTETDINGTSEEVENAAAIAAFRPGDSVIVRSLSGTETPGVTNGTRYWIGKDLTATPAGISFHTTRTNALIRSGTGTGGTPVNLTASTAGNGELWRIDKDNDTRPEIQVTGTDGTFDVAECVLDSFRIVVATAGCTFTQTTISTTGSITQAGAVFTDCSFVDHTTVGAEGFITSDDPELFSGCTFDNTGGRGHALRMTAIGEYDLNDDTFTGYGGSTTLTDHQFDNTSGVSSNQITVDTGDPFVTGDVVVYSDEGGTTLTGLSDNGTYYVNRVSAGVYTLHLNEGDALNGNAVVSITTGTGNETHALYSGNAAVWNDSGGEITLNITGALPPTVRNTSGSTTIIVTAVPVTVTVFDTDANPIEDAQTAVYRSSDNFEILNADTNASGIATTSFGGTTPVAVQVRVRKSSPGDTRYVPVNSPATITTSGLSVTVTLVQDPIAV